MSWPVISGVSISSNSNSVSFTNEEPVSIRTGAALVVEEFSPVEVADVSSDGSKVVSLIEPWPYAAVNNSRALLIPLNGMLFEKVKELVQAIVSINGNFKNLLSKIEELATTDGIVEVTAADGTTYDLQGWLSIPQAFDNKVAEYFNYYRSRQSHSIHEDVVFYRNPVSYWVVPDPHTNLPIDINERRTIYKLCFFESSAGTPLPHCYTVWIWRASDGWNYSYSQQFDLFIRNPKPELDFSTGVPRVYWENDPSEAPFYSTISVTAVYNEGTGVYLSPLAFLLERDIKRKGDDLYYDSYIDTATHREKEIKIINSEEFSPVLDRLSVVESDMIDSGDIDVSTFLDTSQMKDIRRFRFNGFQIVYFSFYHNGPDVEHINWPSGIGFTSVLGQLASVSSFQYLSTTSEFRLVKMGGTYSEFWAYGAVWGTY